MTVWQLWSDTVCQMWDVYLHFNTCTLLVNVLPFSIGSASQSEIPNSCLGLYMPFTCLCCCQCSVALGSYSSWIHPVCLRLHSNCICFTPLHLDDVTFWTSLVLYAFALEVMGFSLHVLCKPMPYSIHSCDSNFPYMGKQCQLGYFLISKTLWVQCEAGVECLVTILYCSS